MSRYGLLGKKLGHSFSREIHSAIGGYEYELIQLDEGSVVASIAKIREDMKDDEETSDEQSEEAGMIEEVLETDSVDNSEENETE